MRRIALVNQKGGCGKTTTAINLTSFLAKEGRRVLLIDLDPQGHAGLGLGIDAEAIEATIYEVLSGKIPLPGAVQPLRDNLDIVPSDVVLSAFEQVMSGVPEREFKLAYSLEQLEAVYDYLIIDSPPSVGLLTFNGLMASEEVIIPVDPSYFSIHGLGKLLDTIQILEEKAGHRLDIKILATNIDRRTNFCKGVVETLTTHFSERCLQTVIHTCTRLREAASHGKPISEFDKRCNASQDYQHLAREILSQEDAVLKKHEKAHGLPELLPREEGKKAVVFTIEAPPSAKVQIAGDFNGWNPEVLNYTDDHGNPAWHKLFSLSPGTYQYKYLVDGQWVTDPGNKETIDDSLGGANSVVSV
jgi:chromosome partitioning protein